MVIERIVNSSDWMFEHKGIIIKEELIFKRIHVSHSKNSTCVIPEYPRLWHSSFSR